MTATLQEIQDAWDEGAGDEAAVRALADEYVAAHPEEFTEYAELSIEQLVAAVDAFRAAGIDPLRQRVETWLWHHFEPQSIGGPAIAQVRAAG